MFPSDEILIARGKYSTLNKERREQMERVQKISHTIMTLANQALGNCHDRIPDNDATFSEICKCIENFKKANELLQTIGAALNEYEPAAWGKNQQEKV